MGDDSETEGDIDAEVAAGLDENLATVQQGAADGSGDTLPGRDPTLPIIKKTAKRKELDSISAQMLSILNSDDDDHVDLAFSSMSKRVKKYLNEEQTDAVMEEIGAVMNRHMQQARLAMKPRGPATNVPVPSTSAAPTQAPEVMGPPIVTPPRQQQNRAQQGGQGIQQQQQHQAHQGNQGIQQQHQAHQGNQQQFQYEYEYNDAMDYTTMLNM